MFLELLLFLVFGFIKSITLTIAFIYSFLLLFELFACSTILWIFLPYSGMIKLSRSVLYARSSDDVISKLFKIGQPNVIIKSISIKIRPIEVLQILIIIVFKQMGRNGCFSIWKFPFNSLTFPFQIFHEAHHLPHLFLVFLFVLSRFGLSFGLFKMS